MNEGRSIPPGRTRGWIWFFLVLAVLTVASITGLNVFIRGRQLALDQLKQARDVWNEKGPRDYNLTWTQTGSVKNTFDVKVRNGKAVSVIPRDAPPLRQEQYHYYSMEALFVIIEDFLTQDAEPGRPRTFSTATFDATDGHVTRFIRRVYGTSEQQDITVELTPVASEGNQER